MRHRAMLLYLRDVVGVGQASCRVLHIGPERALQRWLTAADGVSYVAVDLDSPLATLRADVTRLPFEEGSFDLILCSHVLEHVPDDRAAIAELFRVLRPDGTAIIQVPPDPVAETFEDLSVSSPRVRQRLFDQYDHVRLCGPDYWHRIAAAGFDVSEEDHVRRLPEAARGALGLRAGEPFYVSTKRVHVR
jgi:SAM-dependent methyltransferase